MKLKSGLMTDFRLIDGAPATDDEFMVPGEGLLSGFRDAVRQCCPDVKPEMLRRMMLDACRGWLGNSVKARLGKSDGLSSGLGRKMAQQAILLDLSDVLIGTTSTLNAVLSVSGGPGDFAELAVSDMRTVFGSGSHDFSELKIESCGDPDAPLFSGADDNVGFSVVFLRRLQDPMAVTYPSLDDRSDAHPKGERWAQVVNFTLGCFTGFRASQLARGLPDPCPWPDVDPPSPDVSVLSAAKPV